MAQTVIRHWQIKKYFYKYFYNRIPPLTGIYFSFFKIIS